MGTKTNRALTQKELISELHKLGLTDITERRIIDWREKALLPPFDIGGRGYGKGKGRAISQWKNRRLVIGQAYWIHRLLRIYRYADAIYLPLWMLGCSIPTELVRNVLLESLENLNDVFQSEATEKLKEIEPYERKNGAIEDFIGDTVFSLVSNEKLPEIFGVPQEVLEVLLNIFFNPDYKINRTDDSEDIDFEDCALDGFEDGAKKLAEWKEKLEVIKKRFSQDLELNSESTNEAIKPSGIEMIFEYAPFIQKHFSLHQLIKSVNEATEEDFREVQTDMRVVCLIADSLGRAMAIIMKNITAYPKPTLDEILPTLFIVGNWLTLTDISMRRHGSSEKLNWARGEIIKKIHEMFNDDMEKKLAELSPRYAEAFEKVLKTLEKNFEKLVMAQA